MMTYITFPDDFAERLKKVAERQNRSAAEVVKEMFDHRYGDDDTDDAVMDDPLLRMWEMADEADQPLQVKTSLNIAEKF